MSKQGYKCAKWEPEHNLFLTDNYTVTDSNEQLAALLNAKYSTERTADAVRKQLNVLGLKRPKKSVVKAAKKADGDTFFKSLSKGLKNRKHLEKADEKQTDYERKQKKEKEWAKNVHGVAAPEKLPVVQPPATETVLVRIDSKTQIEVPKGREAYYIQKYKNRHSL